MPAPSLDAVVSQGGSGVDDTITLPSHSEGNLLVIFGCARGNPGFGQYTSTGWTLLEEDIQSAGLGYVMGCWYKTAGASESNPTFTAADSKAAARWIACAISGFDAVDDVGAATGWANAATTTVDAPSVTPTGSDALVLTVAANMDFDGGGHNFTIPSGTTQPTNGEIGDNNGRLELAEYDQASGATGAKQWTGFNASQYKTAMQVVIASAAAASIPGIEVFRTIPGVTH